MTAATFTPGPVIAIEGSKRPWFVRDEDRLQWIGAGPGYMTGWRFWDKSGGSTSGDRLSWEGPANITHIRLDITHPESIRRTWNDAHPDEKPFDAVWMGLPDQPDDWDGGEVLLRRGVRSPGGDITYWPHEGVGNDIIAYRRKPAAETDDDRMEIASAWEIESADNAVRIERRTKVEWMEEWRSRGSLWTLWSENRFTDILRSLDLIAPELTMTDRFMAAHPDADRRTAELFAAFEEAGR